MKRRECSNCQHDGNYKTCPHFYEMEAIQEEMDAEYCEDYIEKEDE